MKKLIFISLMIGMAACSKPAQVDDRQPMLMNAMTKSPTDFGADTPVFLFWLATDFPNIAEGVYTQPYHEAWPFEGIDAYKTKTYDTGKKYPADDSEVWCTGYFPASLTVDDGASPRSWTKLSVPAEDIGILDVMVAKEHITGKSSAHFEKKDPKEPLVFIHAQSKVTFKAKMGTEMAQNRYLRNVRITIPHTELMGTLKWEDGRYIAYERATDENIEVVLTDPETAQLDPNQAVREIGSVYIYPGQDAISVKVEMEMDNTPLFTSPEIISTEAEVPFVLDNVAEYGNVLRENDAYEITLVINYDSIALKGNKALWQDGGKIPLPFYPN